MENSYAEAFTNGTGDPTNGNRRRRFDRNRIGGNRRRNRKYRVPKPGAKKQKKYLRTCVEFPARELYQIMGREKTRFADSAYVELSVQQGNYRKSGYTKGSVNMDSKFEALVNLCRNEEEAKKLFSRTAEDAASYLKEQYHLEFTVDELKDVAAGIRKASDESTSDELTEDQLEDVAGGGKGAYNAGYYIGKVCKIVVSVLPFFL